jgi:hypothetical protein
MTDTPAPPRRKDAWDYIFYVVSTTGCIIPVLMIWYPRIQSLAFAASP